MGGGEEFRDGDRVEKLAPMPDNCHAEVFEIVGVQAKQNVSVDRVLAKGGLILAQTEVPEPNSDIRGRLHLGNLDIRPHSTV